MCKCEKPLNVALGKSRLVPDCNKNALFRGPYLGRKREKEKSPRYKFYLHFYLSKTRYRMAQCYTFAMHWIEFRLRMSVFLLVSITSLRITSLYTIYNMFSYMYSTIKSCFLFFSLNFQNFITILSLSSRFSPSLAMLNMKKEFITRI